MGFLFIRSRGRRVDLVVFDAMFTLFLPRVARRQQMLCNIYRERGKIENGITNAQIWSLILEQRRSMEPIKDDDRYWRIVNQFVLEELGIRTDWSAARAIHIHEEILSNPGLYKVHRSLRRFVKMLRKRGVKVVIGSNQREESLRRLLRHFSLLNTFDAVYTSEQLEERKPSPGFWEKILAQEGVTAEHVIHIGNSANSDTGAAALGIPVFLLDPDNELAGLTEGDFSCLAIPQQSEEQLRKFIDQDLIQVCRSFVRIRDQFESIMSTRA